MPAGIASRRTLLIGLVGGIIHAVVALWMGATVRGEGLWGTIAPNTVSEALVVASTVLGLILLGAIPVILFLRNGLVIPIGALLVLFVGAGYTSWYHFETVRTTSAGSIGLYTDSLFGPLWFITLGIVLALGLVEYAFRRRSSRFSLTSPAA